MCWALVGFPLLGVCPLVSALKYYEHAGAANAAYVNNTTEGPCAVFRYFLRSQICSTNGLGLTVLDSQGADYRITYMDPRLHLRLIASQVHDEAARIVGISVHS